MTFALFLFMISIRSYLAGGIPRKWAFLYDHSGRLLGSILDKDSLSGLFLLDFIAAAVAINQSALDNAESLVEAALVNDDRVGRAKVLEPDAGLRQKFLYFNEYLAARTVVLDNGLRLGLRKMGRGSRILTKFAFFSQ